MQTDVGCASTNDESIRLGRRSNGRFGVWCDHEKWGERNVPRITVQIEVNAPIEEVFDLCRSVDVHMDSAGNTKEQAVAGVTTGIMELGDEVTWLATHFGVRQTLTSRITKLDRPRMFRDSMVSGAFRRFDHDHIFTRVGQMTMVQDHFDFDAPFGPLGWIANRLFLVRYMRAFLVTRLNSIKDLAESGAARHYLDLASRARQADGHSRSGMGGSSPGD